jgi:sugar lactone lactonase YvrE
LPAGNANGVAFDPSGSAIAIAHDTAPWVTAYPFSSGYGTKYADPATTPTGEGKSVAFI